MVEQLKGSAPLFHPGWRKENGKDGPELKQWYKEAKEATVYAQVRRLIFELEASSPTVHELCVREGLEEKSDAALQKTLLTPKERKPTAAASKTIVSTVKSFVADSRAPFGGHAPSAPVAEDSDLTPQRPAALLVPKRSPAVDPTQAAAARKRRLDELAGLQQKQQRVVKQQRLQKQLDRSSQGRREPPEETGAASAAALSSGAAASSAPPERKRLVKGAPMSAGAGAGGSSGGATSAPSAPAEHPEHDAPWDSSTNAQAQIGRRLQLYWGGDRKWFKGTITKFNTLTWAAFISYEDGDVKVIPSPRRVRWSLRPACCPALLPASRNAPSSTRSRRRPRPFAVAPHVRGALRVARRQGADGQRG